jgi:hypothetical protein
LFCGEVVVYFTAPNELIESKKIIGTHKKIEAYHILSGFP